MTGFLAVRSTLALCALGLLLVPASGVRAVEPPVIERIEPSSGPVGTIVRISGRRFPSNARVSAGSTALAVEDSLPNLIRARIVPNTRSGWIAVQTGAGNVLGPEFVVTEALALPIIESIEPTRAAPGAEVVIRGQHFSSRMAEDFVRFGDHVAVVTFASPVELRVVVPQDAVSGAVSVRVAQAGEVTRASHGPDVSALHSAGHSETASTNA